MSVPVPRLTAQDFDQELLILFDAYVHGNIDRRGFLDRAQKFAVGGLTAAGLLAALSPNFAFGQVIKPTDDRIKTETLEFATNGYGKMKGYLCRPTSAGSRRDDLAKVAIFASRDGYFKDRGMKMEKHRCLGTSID